MNSIDEDSTLQRSGQANYLLIKYTKEFAGDLLLSASERCVDDARRAINVDDVRAARDEVYERQRTFS